MRDVSIDHERTKRAFAHYYRRARLERKLDELTANGASPGATRQTIRTGHASAAVVGAYATVMGAPRAVLIGEEELVPDEAEAPAAAQPAGQAAPAASPDAPAANTDLPLIAMFAALVMTQNEGPDAPAKQAKVAAVRGILADVHVSIGGF